MADHWLPHAIGGAVRAARLRWQTRGGFSVGLTPAFAADAAEWFSDRLRQTSHYIEYGSGASTRLAAGAGVCTISMEGDPRYARAVRRALPDDAPVTVLDAELGLTAEWSFPVFTRPSPARLARWRRYATRPLELAASQGWTPQLVLIDGRFRRSCALHAARTIVEAGGSAALFFDDYATRAHYHSVERYLGPPRIIGLSAIFDIGPQSPLGRDGIAEDVLAEAARDFR